MEGFGDWQGYAKLKDLLREKVLQAIESFDCIRSEFGGALIEALSVTSV